MSKYLVLIAAAAALSVATGVHADDLWTSFSTPPASSRPLVYWHWVDGNVTRDGIRQDFQWLSDIGVGGVALFDVKLTGEKRIPHPQTYMSQEWKQHFAYAAKLAHDHHMTFSVAATQGWSMTGGASVPIRDGMKKLVWSQVDVEGNAFFDAALPPLPDVAGPFQSQPARYSIVFRTIGTAKPLPAYSEDYKVIAFPISQSDRAPVSVRDVNGPIDPPTRLDGDDLSQGIITKLDAVTHEGELTLDYGAPLTASAATVFIPDHPIPFHAPPERAALQYASKAGWTTVATFAPSTLPVTKAFAPVSAQHWRLWIYNDTSVKDGPGFEHPDGATEATFNDPEVKPDQVEIRELALHSAARIDQFQLKAGFASSPVIPETLNGQDSGIAPEAVIDLTALVHDGHLRWQAPAGRWRILRIGYSSNGSTNEPAEDIATGPEVDKFDALATRTYISSYLDDRIKLTDPQASGARIAALFVDSNEAKPANWSPNIPAAFQQSYGYTIDPWLPALAGYVVKNRAASDAFLSRYRYLLGTLTEVNHYKVLADEAKRRGLTVFGEAHENGRPFFGDDITLRKYADVPMGAMWAYRGNAPQPVSEMDLRGASSVASLYGKAKVGAESLTSAFSYWAYGPEDLKAMLETEYALGVTLPVIHSTVHQPVNDGGPGIPLWIFGQYFNRLDTWADYAKPLVTYMSRMDAVLSQGTRPSRILFLYGDDIPLVAQYQKALPIDVPVAHAFDFVSGRALMQDFNVTDGALVSPSGQRYGAVILGGKLGALPQDLGDKLSKFAATGGHLLGPALMDSSVPHVPGAVSPKTSAAPPPVRVEGDGSNVDEVLDGLGLYRDIAGLPANGRVIYMRRSHQSQEIYFLKNLDAKAFSGDLSFPFKARCAELWDPVAVTRQTLTSSPPTGSTLLKDVSLKMGQSALLVFDKADDATCAPAIGRRETKVLTGWRRHIKGSKDVLSASPSDLAMSPVLKDRRYAGKISYNTRLYLNAVPSGKMALAFSKIGVAGEVFCNGKSMGIVWAAPYEVPLKGCLKPGWNAIRVSVATLWVNALIDKGQGQGPVKAKSYYQAKTLPVLAGLSGPVYLVRYTR